MAVPLALTSKRTRPSGIPVIATGQAPTSGWLTSSGLAAAAASAVPNQAATGSRTFPVANQIARAVTKATTAAGAQSDRPQRVRVARVRPREKAAAWNHEAEGQRLQLAARRRLDQAPSSSAVRRHREQGSGPIVAAVSGPHGKPARRKCEWFRTLRISQGRCARSDGGACATQVSRHGRGARSAPTALDGSAQRRPPAKAAATRGDRSPSSLGSVASADDSPPNRRSRSRNSRSASARSSAPKSGHSRSVK